MLEDFLKGAEKVVVCGIGNDVRGDDAFGVIVVEELKNRIKSDKVIILNCGEVPESYLGKIINENPTHVIFIDAVDFGGKPGEIVIADPEGTLGESFSTHRLPLKLLVGYLKQNINAKFILIGCQPKQLGLFVEMSEEVRKSAEKLVEILAQELKF
ncbi:hydrogenase maturation peptidase HycI [Thermococcus paralvinellae]|uniref:Cytochrome F420 hydrogenase maturation protease n=1 Tax=Thermococcus paralvinellae TaxID=582419 RepID=W0I8L0_9EURY|nr:hydrogenase maturation peptidase HycI [Thermococcus paralvinellae]AHF80763.1 cytochrome F420 hydrogenase maturation protease [Thermococcus paralvinellae]